MINVSNTSALVTQIKNSNNLLPATSAGRSIKSTHHSGSSGSRSGSNGHRRDSASLSGHSTVSSNGSSSGGGMVNLAAMYTTTPAEDAQLDKLVTRLQKMFVTYIAVHGGRHGAHGHHHNHSNHTHSAGAGAGAGGSPRAGLTTPRKTLPHHNNHNNSSNQNSSHDGSQYSINAASVYGNMSMNNSMSMHSMSMRQMSASTDGANVRSPTTSGTTGAMSSSKARLNKLASDELRSCYNEVPELFFRPDFSLLNPEIFNQTLMIKDIVEGAGGDSGSRSTSKSGQEGTKIIGAAQVQKKLVSARTRTYSSEDISVLMSRGLNGDSSSQDALSHYLDLVEVALLRQIWLRSPAFFRALDDIKGLQFQVIFKITTFKAKYCAYSFVFL
jgi:hypothetical protein